MCKKYLQYFFFVIFLALKNNSPLAATEFSTVSPLTVDFLPVSEYELKAAFLYNLGHFVSWPPNAMNNGYFLICVLGKDPFQGMLELAISGKQLHHQPIKLRYLKRVEEGLDCQIIFISQSEEQSLSSILPALEKHPILTVSDINHFLDEGGMIRFLVRDDRVRLQINKTNANKAELVISSKLLTLAEILK